MTNENNTFFLDEVNNLAKLDKNLLISMSEEMYHQQIEDLVEELIKKETARIVLIAGPSSSGKTTTSLLISKYLENINKKAIIVSLDDFFLDREKTPLLPNGKYDFENITALDLDCFNNFIDDLFTKNKAQMPVFNFLTGKREQKLKDVEIDDNTFIIIEGLHALNPILINKTQEKLFKVYICVLSNFNYGERLEIDYTNLRLMRRFIRDYHTRGRSIQKTLETWQEVLNGEKLYIDPYKNDVDFNVDSTHMYEPLMYATYLKPLLEKSNFQISKDLCKMLDAEIENKK